LTSISSGKDWTTPPNGLVRGSIHLPKCGSIHELLLRLVLYSFIPLPHPSLVLKASWSGIGGRGSGYLYPHLNRGSFQFA